MLTYPVDIKRIKGLDFEAIMAYSDLEVKPMSTEYAEFEISGQKVIVDTEDKWLIEIHSWYYSEKGGVQWKKWHDGPIVSLHNLLLKCPEGKRVDHKNRKNWDNRKENLRICTQSENQYNRAKQIGYGSDYCSSEYKGVMWETARKCWRAVIQVNKKSIFLGRFHSEIEAAKAYNEAAKKYHGEFAVLNEIPAQ